MHFEHRRLKTWRCLENLGQEDSICATPVRQQSTQVLEDGQPWHTKSSLAVQDNISVLQKPPVTGEFLLKGADAGRNS